MKRVGMSFIFSLSLISAYLLSSCTSLSTDDDYTSNFAMASFSQDYSSRIPQQIASSEKTVVVNPNVHVWGAYENGNLVKAGLASAGADFCPDLGRRCHTSVGSYRVFSLGSSDCKSRTFPLHKGGAPMPYCMFFAHGMALHGVPDHEVGEGNYSHGCVRLRIADAEWLRFNFVNIGTRVVVKPY